MTDLNWLRAIKTVNEQSLRDLPAQHSRRTASCPSMARLERERHAGLSMEVQTHIEDCAYCRGILNRLVELDRRDDVKPVILSVKSAGQLTNPTTAAAKTAGGLLPLAVAQDGGLTAEVVQTAGIIQLEVRTKDPAYNLKLIRYAFRTADGTEAEVGFAVLQADQDDWFAACVELNANDLFRKVNGVCVPEVRVAPPLPDLLDDRLALLASVVREAADPQTQVAWRAWLDASLNQLPAGSDAVYQLLTEVQARLPR